MDILNKKKQLQEEINKCNKKISELNKCISSNEKQINDITCEINKLNKKIMNLKLKKEKTLCFYCKVITILSLVVIFPVLIKFLYIFITFFGAKFMGATDIVSRYGYGLVTLLGGGLITFGGPILIRNIIDNIVKFSSIIIVNSSKYKCIDDLIENTKKKMDDLNLSRSNMIREKNDMIFEYSKYSALFKVSGWLLNNIDNNLTMDNRSYDTKKTGRSYTRRREKDDFVKK